jgi:hypothetical protein
MEYFSNSGVYPVVYLLRMSVERLNLTLSMCKGCRDPDMRNWYQDILKMVRDDLYLRKSAEYEMGTGLPHGGNPVRWADSAVFPCMGLREAPARVNEWYDLRQWIVTKHGRAEEKKQKLRTFFSH